MTLIMALPPPATIPSAIAALVAATASSIFNFKYFISVSVAAPTRITATPPESLAMRSSIFSLSYFESVCSLCFLSCLILSSISAFLPRPPTIKVLSLVATTRTAFPSISTVALSNFTPSSSETTWAPRVTAIS